MLQRVGETNYTFLENFSGNSFEQPEHLKERIFGLSKETCDPLFTMIPLYWRVEQNKAGLKKI